MLHRLHRRLGHEVVGMSSSSAGDGSVQFLAVSEGSITQTVQRLKPHRIYYLRTFHSGSVSRDVGGTEVRSEVERYISANISYLSETLEAVRQYSPASRLLFASSSLIYGDFRIEKLNESSFFNPQGFYAAFKLLGMSLIDRYRLDYGLHVSSAIFFNHESSLRPEGFLFPRLISAAREISLRKGQPIQISFLDDVHDWGDANEYVDAARQILNLDEPHNLVVGTGRANTVRNLVEAVFLRFGLNYRDWIDDSEPSARPAQRRVSDPRKLEEVTGWKAEGDLNRLVDSVLARV